MLLTQSEKERLAVLLREIEVEEEDSARGGDSEVGQHEALTDNICRRMNLFFRFLNSPPSCLEVL